MLSKQRVMIAGGLLLTAAAGWWWFRRAPVVDVEIAVVSVGPLRVSVDETGTTRVREHTDVNAPIGGRWVPVSLREGDVLKAGARLGMLYPAPMDAAAREQAVARVGAAAALVREAESRVAAARTALDEARRTVARAESLGAAGGIAPQEVERARDDVSLRGLDVRAAGERLRVARYEQTQAKAALDGASGQAGGLPLTAPMTGTLLDIAEPHERVVPAGTRLLEIGDPRDIEIVVPLLTADALRVKEGATVQLTFGEAGVNATEGKSDTIAGRVERIEPAAYTRLSALGVEEQRVDVLVHVPATAVHVGDHFRADARITVWESPRVSQVPAGALVRDGNGWAVWLVTRGRVERRTIGVGERGADQVEVRSGLQPGDTVVLFPGDRVQAGARIRLK